MKIQILIFGIALCCFLPCAYAQVYKCDGKWTNTPCNENSKPVEGLPVISRAEIGIENAPAQPEKGSSALSTNGSYKKCQIEYSGVTLKMSELRLTPGHSGPVLNGRIRNISNRGVTSPVLVEVSAPGIDMDYARQVAKYLSADQIASFSFFLPERIAKSPFVDVRLHYSPAAICPRERVSNPKVTAAIGTNSNNRLNELKEDLKILDRRIKTQLRKKGREIKFSNSIFAAEYQKINHQFKRICSTVNEEQVGEHLRARFLTECRRTKELISDLYHKAHG